MASRHFIIVRFVCSSPRQCLIYLVYDSLGQVLQVCFNNLQVLGLEEEIINVKYKFLELYYIVFKS